MQTQRFSFVTPNSTEQLAGCSKHRKHDVTLPSLARSSFQTSIGIQNANTTSYELGPSHCRFNIHFPSTESRTVIFPIKELQTMLDLSSSYFQKTLPSIEVCGSNNEHHGWASRFAIPAADLAYGEELHGLAEGKSNMWIDNIENLMKLMPILVLVTISPLLSKALQFVAGPKIRKSQAKHRAASEAMTMKRINRKKQADRGDFMDYMMRSRGEKHEMTDAELVSNCDLLMIAGSETTASLLSGATYWLLKTPCALKKVTHEVRSMFERDEDIKFKEASAKLPYMLACLDEALRIFPSIPLSLSRQTLPGAPTTIAGMMIPENVTTYLHSFLLTRH